VPQNLTVAPTDHALTVIVRASNLQAVARRPFQQALRQSRSPNGEVAYRPHQCMMLDIQSAHRSERREQLKSTHRDWTPEALTLPRLNLRNNTLQPGWRGAV
jgi:hypothetical protein